MALRKDKKKDERNALAKIREGTKQAAKTAKYFSGKNAAGTGVGRKREQTKPVTTTGTSGKIRQNNKAKPGVVSKVKQKATYKAKSVNYNANYGNPRPKSANQSKKKATAMETRLDSTKPKTARQTKPKYSYRSKDDANYVKGNPFAKKSDFSNATKAVGNFLSKQKGIADTTLYYSRKNETMKRKYGNTRPTYDYTWQTREQDRKNAENKKVLDAYARTQSENMQMELNRALDGSETLWRNANQDNIKVDFQNRKIYFKGHQMTQDEADRMFPLGFSNAENRKLLEDFGYEVNNKWWRGYGDYVSDREKAMAMAPYLNNADTDKVSPTDNARIAEYQANWAKYNEAGNKDAAARQHELAERVRANYGYSGGLGGDQTIRGNVSMNEYQQLNSEGDAALSMARLELQRATTEEERARAEQKISQILSNARYQEENASRLRQLTSGAAKSGIGGTAHMIEGIGWGAENLAREKAMPQWLKMEQEIPSLESELQSIDESIARYGRDLQGRDRDEVEKRLNRARQASAELERMKTDPHSVYYERPDLNAEWKPTTWAERMIAEGQKEREQAMEGWNSVQRFAGDLYSNMIQMAPTTIAAMVPGAQGTTIGTIGAIARNGALAAMSLSAGGQRMQELQQRGISQEEAERGGLFATAAEFGTEKLPMEYLHKLATGPTRTGAKVLAGLGTASAIEGAEEGLSYTANAAYSYLMGYEEDKFNVADMARDVLSGAIMGGLHAGIGMAVNHAVNHFTRQGDNQSSQWLIDRVDELDRMVQESQDYHQLAAQGVITEDENASIQEQIRSRVEFDLQQMHGVMTQIQEAQTLADQGAYSQEEADQIRNALGEEITGNQTFSEQDVQNTNSLGMMMRIAANSMNADTSAERESREQAEKSEKVRNLYALGQTVMNRYSDAPRTLEEAAEMRTAEQQTEQKEAPKEEKPTLVQLSRTVNANDPITQTANMLGDNGAVAIQKAAVSVVGDMNRLRFARGFTQVYNQALSGNENVPKPPMMNEAQYNAAIRSARMDRSAGLSAEMANAQTAAGYNRNAGVNMDDPYVKSMDKNTVRLVDKIAKDLGVRVEFVDAGSIRTKSGRTANADIRGNVIRIEKGNVNPVVKLIGHEILHRMQDVSPETYRAFRDYVMQIPGQSALLNQTLSTYRNAGSNINIEGAMDEIAADFAGNLLYDSAELQRFVQRNKQNRNLLQKILDVFRDLAAKLTGRDKAKADDAVRLLEDALSAATERTGRMKKVGDDTTRNNRAGLAGEEDAIDPPGRMSISSLGDALGFEARRYADGHVEFYRNGKQVKKVTAADVKKSRMGQLITIAAQNGYISESDVTKQTRYLARLTNMILETKDAQMVYEFIGSMSWSAVKDNSDKQYGMTIDFEAICKKTEAMVAAMSEAMMRKGRGLSLDEIDVLYSKVVDAGETVPCPPCYVFSRWIGLGGLLDNINSFQKEFPDTSDGTERAERRIDEIREILADEITALQAQDKERVRLNEEAVARGEKKGKKDLTLKTLDEITNAAKKKRLEELNKQENKLITKRNKALSKLQFDKLSDSERAKIEKELDKLNDQYTELTRQIRIMRMYSWLKDVRLSQTYKEVPNDVLFDLRAGERFADQYADTWAFRTGQGAYYGKAITPYTDARLGEIIQGVHKSANDIKIGDDNPFSGAFDATALTNKQRDELNAAYTAVKRQNLRGGVRMQSVSDFRYEYGLDYIQSFYELQAIGAAIQTYTKVVEFVDMAASTGAFVNMSLIPWGNGFKDGKLAYSSATGMDAEAAFKLQKQWDTAGTILIGVSDEHIRAAMADKNIYFIIPYHKSGGRDDVIRGMLSALGEKIEKYEDYTYVQSEKFPSSANPVLTLRNKILTANKYFELNSKEQALVEGNEILRSLYNRKFFAEDDPLYGVQLLSEDCKHIYPYEYWDTNSTYKTADINGKRYIDWCEALDVKPKFSGDADGNHDFRNDKGYWKLLIDRRMYGRNGKYNPLVHINVSGLSLNQLDRERAKERFGEAMTAPADLRKTKSIVDAAFPETVAEDYTTEGRFSLVTDKNTLDFLENQEHMTVYRAMQVIDGGLYPPMAAKVGGKTGPRKLVPATLKNKWYQSDERPDLITKTKMAKDKYSPTGEMFEQGYFILDKGNGSSPLEVAYNPYWHTSLSMLNDQFKEAWARPNMVIARCEIPVSEITSGYRAKYAKDPVGLIEWNAGDVAKHLKGTEDARKVYLSRYMKVIDVVPVDEAADSIAAILLKHDLTLPSNVVTPDMLDALKARGVKVSESWAIKSDTYMNAVAEGNMELAQAMANEAAKEAGVEGPVEAVEYTAKGGVRSLLSRYPILKKTQEKRDAALGRTGRYSIPSDSEYLDAVDRGDMETAQRMVDEAAKAAMPNSKILDEDGSLLKVYHGSDQEFTVFDRSKARANMDIQGSFFSPWEEDADGYGATVRVFYLNITNPADEQTAYKALNKFKGENKAGVKARIYLGARGYDGVNNSNEEYIAFKPEQIKSADPVTYDDDGNIIPLSERFNPNAEDIRYSLGTEGFDQAQLMRENQQLRDKLAYWKAQTKRSDRTKSNPKDVRKLAKKLAGDFSTTMDTAEIAGSLQAIYDGLGKDWTYDEAYHAARILARDMVEQASATDDYLYNEYDPMRKFFRENQLVLSPSDRAGITDYNDWRKAQMGRITIKHGDKSNVDQYYKDLADLWPEFFREERESNSVDQLERIAEVLDNVYSRKEVNPFGDDIDGPAEYLAAEIMQSFWDLPGVAMTYADRVAEQYDIKTERAKKRQRAAVQREREKGNARVQREKERGERRLRQEQMRGAFDRDEAALLADWREAKARREGRRDRDAALAKMRAAHKEKYENALRAMREDRDARLQVQKEKYLGKEKARSQRQKEREMVAKISRHARDLSAKLLRANDKKHLPDGFDAPVAMFLDSINLSSSNHKNTKRTEAFQALRLAYRDIIENHVADTMTIDPDLMDNIMEVEAMKDIPIQDMSMSQLEVIWRTLRAVEASITTANKAFGQQRFATIFDAADGLRQEMARGKDRGTYRGPLKSMDRLLNSTMLTPESYFHRMGYMGENIFRMLRDAQDKHITIMQEAQEYTRKAVGKEKIRKWEKEVHHFKFDGRDVELTTAQIMSLYELMKRQQAIDHITVGGFRPDVVSKGLKEHAPTAPYRLDLDQISEIVDALTDEQMRIADKLQQFMGGRLSELGNEASLAIYGYKKFNEKNYFPIKTDKNQVLTDQVKQAQSATISGRGFTKGTKPHANNALIVGNIFDVFSNHVTDMATYSAWLEAMENLQKIYNFTFRDEDRNVTGTVKQYLEKTFGKNGLEYWEKLTENLNNGVHGTNENPFNAFVGNYKASAIGANIRVFIQQPTAILRAMDQINPIDFIAGIGRGTVFNTWKKVKKYAPIAVWKDWGYFDADTGRQMKSILFGDDGAIGKFNNAMMAPAGFMDSVGWSQIWNALEAETRRTKKHLKPKSEEFYREVAKRFNEVIDHTQVVDGILQRSQVMRSSDGITKMATSFMSEPTKVYNMFTTAVYDLNHAKDPHVRAAAMKTLGRTTFALCLSFVANAAAQSIVDALRDEDKDETYWEKFFQAFLGYNGDEETTLDKVKGAFMGGNMAQSINPVTYIPWAKDIMSAIQGYSVSRMDMDSITKFVQALSSGWKAANGEGKRTVTNALAEIFAQGSRLLGVPVSNMKRDALGIYRTVMNSQQNYRGLYELEKVLYRIDYDKNLSMFMETAYLARKNGDMEAYEAIRADMLENAPTDSEKFDKKISDLEQKDVEATEAYQTELATMSDTYATMLESNTTFNEMPTEAQDKARDTMEKYAQYKVLGDRMELDNDKMKKLDDIEAQDLPVADWVVFKTEFDTLHSIKDENGKTTKSRQEQAIELIDQTFDTKEQKCAAYRSVYDSDANNPWA